MNVSLLRQTRIILPALLSYIFGFAFFGFVAVYKVYCLLIEKLRGTNKSSLIVSWKSRPFKVDDRDNSQKGNWEKFSKINFNFIKWIKEIILKILNLTTLHTYESKNLLLINSVCHSVPSGCTLWHWGRKVETNVVMKNQPTMNTFKLKI